MVARLRISWPGPPAGELLTHKLLSEDSVHYEDTAMHGVRQLLDLPKNVPLPTDDLIEHIKMGTTVGTNALLERKGERTVLVTTRGFGDALRIGYQNRPDIFAQQIILPDQLYEKVIEVEERFGANGQELLPLNLKAAKAGLKVAFESGIRAVAIVLVHSYRCPEHEIRRRRRRRRRKEKPKKEARSTQSG